MNFSVLLFHVTCVNSKFYVNLSNNLSMKESKKNIIDLILIAFGVVILFYIFKRFFIDIKETVSSDLLSDEGKKILNDPIKREMLSDAVDHYHETGRWDTLENVSN